MIQYGEVNQFEVRQQIGGLEEEELDQMLKEALTERKQVFRRHPSSPGVGIRVSPEGVFLVTPPRRSRDDNRVLSRINFRIAQACDPHLRHSLTTLSCPECGSYLLGIKVASGTGSKDRRELHCSHPDCDKAYMEIEDQGKLRHKEFGTHRIVRL